MRGAGALRWPALVSLYLASRLAGLTALPMFLDERIHLQWATWLSEGHRLRLPFISGRGLSVWLLAGVAPGAGDPLLAGRLLTVAVGLVALVASHRLTLRATGSAGAADLAALFYIVCPFTLFHDRMVLTDSYLAAFTALTLLFSMVLAEAPSLRTAVALGAALALGVLSKTTGLVLFAVPLLALLALGRDRRRALPSFAAAHALAALLVAYPMSVFFARTSELSGALGRRENEQSLAANAVTNLRLAGEWLWAYWTPGLIVLGVTGLAFATAHRGRRRAAVLLASLAVLPTAAFVAAAEIWYPRYLLFTTIPLLPLSAWGFVAVAEAVRQRARIGSVAGAVLATAALLLLLLPALRFDARLWTDPATAPLPALDRFQYVTGWPSGYGSADTVAYIRQGTASASAPVAVVSPSRSPTAGTLRFLQGRGFPVNVLYLDPHRAGTLDELRALAGKGAAYVLVSPIQGGQVHEAWRPALEREFVSYKPDGTVTDELYRVCASERCPGGLGAGPSTRNATPSR